MAQPKGTSHDRDGRRVHSGGYWFAKIMLSVLLPYIDKQYPSDHQRKLPKLANR